MYRTHPRPGIITPFRGVQRPLWPFAVNRDSPQAEGLVAWWPFAMAGDSGAYDQVGFSQGSIVNGSLTWVADDLLNVQGNLSGTTIFDAGNDPSTQITNAPLTISGWTIPNIDNFYRRLLSRELHFIFGAQNNQLLFGMGSGGGWNSLATFGAGAALTNGLLYLLTVSYDGATATGYLNGSQVGSPITAAVQNSGNDLFIGSYNAGGTSQSWTGTVADLRFYNRALSPAEVAELYDPRTRWDLYYPLRQRVWSLPPASSVPVAPTLSAVAGNAQVALSWTSSSGASSYNLYRSTISGGETLLQSGIASTSFTDTTAINGNIYFYEVTAVNGAGESARSNEVSAVPLGRNINLTGSVGTQISLTGSQGTQIGLIGSDGTKISLGGSVN